MEHVDRDSFQQQFNVPRGTMARLDRYAQLLGEWQARMNLVGPATLPDIWSRHFADSAQLSTIVSTGKSWLDIGAGGGFPGLVLAAMEHGRFTLVDSVQKKAAFLSAVVGDMGLQERVEVRCARVEALPTLGVDVVTARAVAPLATLFDWGIRHVKPGGVLVFPKGRRWAEEVSDARMRFLFDLDAFQSMTDPDARILAVRNLKRR